MLFQQDESGGDPGSGADYRAGQVQSLGKWTTHRELPSGLDSFPAWGDDTLSFRSLVESRHAIDIYISVVTNIYVRVLSLEIWLYLYYYPYAARRSR